MWFIMEMSLATDSNIDWNASLKKPSLKKVFITKIF